ncbi:MAG: N-acetyltransferase [Alphaproteobacteria bacterium]|nr:N-acetyltransferase [Alphaproteobacteria bacterium]
MVRSRSRRSGAHVIAKVVPIPSIVETDRLRLRPFALGDERTLVKKLANRNVAQQLTYVPYPYRVTDARAWIEDCLAHPPSPSGGCRFAVELRHTGEALGGISLLPHVLGHELGYWLGKGYWRQGYATEAAKALLVFATQELSIRRFVAFVFDGNVASIRVVEKLGFHRIGVETIVRPGGGKQTVLRYVRLMPR